MNLVDFVPIISEDQGIIVLYKLNITSEEYEKIGEYSDMGEIPLRFAYARVTTILGFNASGYDGIKICIM